MNYDRLDAEEQQYDKEKKYLDNLVKRNKKESAKMLLSIKEDICSYDSYIKKPNRVKAFFNNILLTLLKKF